MFQFLSGEIAPDNMLVCIATADAAHLGVLSSTVHTTWALAAGGRLGVGNDPRYNKSRCFEPFPFPDLESGGDPGEEGASGSHGQVSLAAIRRIAEMIDAHRKRQQAAYPELTMTGMYNVLEKIRASEPLNEKERAIHSQGLVSVLRELHDELDDIVLQAYGWADLLLLLRIAHGNETQELSREEAWREWEESILERLVVLNSRRAKEEANGVVHWLRPEFQNPDATTIPAQARITIGAGTPDEIEDAAAGPAVSSSKPRAWPKDPIEQVRAVAEVLSSNSAPMAVEDVAARFTSRGAWKKRIEPLLEMLVALGRASEEGGQYRARN